MPKLEHDEIEYLFRKTSRVQIVGEHLLNGALLKVASIRSFGVQEKAVNPIFEIYAKPFLVWNREASFFSIKDFARDATGKSLLGDVLGGETAHFEVLRQRSCKFQNLVVEQRHTKLDRIGHGHLIGFNE